MVTFLIFIFDETLRASPSLRLEPEVARTLSLSKCRSIEGQHREYQDDTICTVLSCSHSGDAASSAA